MDNTNNYATETELRHFGFVFGALIAGIFGVLWPWLHKVPFPIWPWLISGAAVTLAALKPAWLRYVHEAWLRIGSLLGYINTRIILGLLFYFLIAPIGVVTRVFRKTNNYQFDPALKTYKKPSEKRPVNHMEKPY